jgi:hypothetical protein
MEAFCSLSAPAIEEMSGSYDGHLPAEIEKNWQQFVADTGAGTWLGKTFQVESGGRQVQRGYNRYQVDGEVKTGLQFDFMEGASRFDGRPSILLRYGPYRNWAGEQDLVDELRIFAPGILLGLYHTRTPVPGFTPRAGGDRSAPEFFVLTGPVEAAPNPT